VAVHDKAVRRKSLDILSTSGNVKNTFAGIAFEMVMVGNRGELEAGALAG